MTKSRFAIIFALAFLFLTFSNCQRLEIERGTPRCIKKKIRSFSFTSSCNDPSVEAYTFQDQTVYVFGEGTCGADFSSEVLDESCNSLGFLGGFIGNTTINGESFSDAVFIETVWEP